MDFTVSNKITSDYKMCCLND